MTIFIPTAGAAVLGYSVLYLQWRRGRGVGLFVLSTLPLGVLFLAGAASPGQHPVDCLVMEYLEGETLAARRDRGPLPLDETLGFGAGGVAPITGFVWPSATMSALDRSFSVTGDV